MKAAQDFVGDPIVYLVVVHGILEHTTLLKVVPLVAQHVVDCLLLLVQAHSLLLLLNHLVLVHDAVLHLSTHLLHVGLVHQLLLPLLLLLHPAVAVHPVEQGVPVEHQVCLLIIFQ